MVGLVSLSIGREPNERSKTGSPFERFYLRRNDSSYHLCEILGDEDLVDQLWFQKLHARREKRYIDPRI